LFFGFLVFGFAFLHLVFHYFFLEFFKTDSFFFTKFFDLEKEPDKEAVVDYCIQNFGLKSKKDVLDFYRTLDCLWAIVSSEWRQKRNSIEHACELRCRKGDYRFSEYG
tara:strand:- start:14 stop:337 length:324 start_codon:yes stop_codon:yes gene_type:complete